MNPDVQSLLFGLIGLLLLKSLTFLIGRSIKAFCVVDVVWAASFGVLVLYWLSARDWGGLRQQVFAGMFVLWSLRLASHLYSRWAGHQFGEDQRYANFHEEWAPKSDLVMFGFFLLQALSVWLLAAPMYPVLTDESTQLELLHWIALALFVLAVLGEMTADRQLQHFKRTVGKGVCREGLWAWSRHPNYFFEFLIWVSFSLFVLGSPRGWSSLIGPALIYYFLNYKTGIPATEEQSLKSKGDAYLQYQKEVSAFFPIPPKLKPTQAES